MLVNDVFVEDKAENESSLKYGFRLMSSYQITETKKLWVISEGDRSVTTLLLPAEYGRALARFDTAGPLSGSHMHGSPLARRSAFPFMEGAEEGIGVLVP